MTTHVLILGGTGLISTRITQQLLARGDGVAVWHYNRGQRKLGFGDVAFTGPINTLIGDRRQYAVFEAQMRAPDLPRFNAVIDMIGFVPDDVECAIRAFRGRVGHYIFCSTVDVYQHPAPVGQPNGQLPYREDAPRLGRNDYARNKIRCEEILEAAHGDDLPITIIRPAATYAEGAGILDSLRGRKTYLDRLRKGKPIIVHGDGQSLWCSCHADDVAQAFVGAVGNPLAKGRSYHVTGEEFLTWDQHHQVVAKAIGAPEPTLIHIPTEMLAALLPSADLADAAHWTLTNFQFNNIFDNTAARSDLGFRYTVSWEEGARRLVDWLDAHGRVDNSDLDHFDDNLIAAWEKAVEAMKTTWTQTAQIRFAGKTRPKPRSHILAKRGKGKSK